jgi:MFS family permease
MMNHEAVLAHADDDAPVATVHRARRLWLELTVATSAQFAASVLQQGTFVLGVFFATTYALDLARMGTAISSLTFGLIFSGLYIGSLVDIFGPRVVQLLGTLVLFALTAGLAVVHSLTATVLLLFLVGLALGSVPIAGTKAVMMAFPRERRGLPMGIRQMGVPLGALAAALVLPSIASKVGVHQVYWGFAAVIAVCGLSYAALLPRYARRGRTASEGGARLGSEMGRVVIPCVTGFCLAWGQYAILAYTIPALQVSQGLSVALAGIVLALSQVGGALGRILFGAISDRLHARRDGVLAATAACSTVLVVGVSFLPRGATMLILAPLWLLMGLTLVGWNALVLTWAGERVSPHNAGAAMGITTSAILFGATVATPVFGVIVEASHGFRAAWLMLAAVLGAAALLLFVVSRRTVGDT